MPDPAPERRDALPAPEGILVVGAPRSGTTLVRRLLDAHPDVACPGETRLFTACARFLATERVVGGMDVGVLNGLAFAGFEPDEVLERLRAFAFAFPREHARRAGVRRWAEKTAVDAFHLREIEALCGDRVHYVAVVRHGLDVACSVREWVAKSEAHPAELVPYVARHARPLEAYCHAWVDVMASLDALRRARPERVIVLRYEDVLADPEAELARLFEGLGERVVPDLLRRAFEGDAPAGFGDWKTHARTGVDAASVERWRRLPETTRSELGAIANPTLERWGYAPVELAEAPGAEEARRRYELGLRLQALRRDDDAAG